MTDATPTAEITMRAFELLEPRTLAEACSALAEEPEARPIAGGTAFLTILKQRLLSPKTLVNLKKVRDGSRISFDPARGLRIGALATVHEIETSSLVREHYPLLADACQSVANIRIRHMATIGGNLAHGDYQSDPPTALAVLDASIEIVASGGVRTIELRDFQRGAYETALGPGELITAILIPALAQGFRGKYIKFTTGSSEERPCVGVAVLARIEDRVCRDLRVALGAVSPKAVRISAGEEMARGVQLHAEVTERIADQAANAVDPIEDVPAAADYKRHLVRVLVRRALVAVANGSVERGS